MTMGIAAPQPGPAPRSGGTAAGLTDRAAGLTLAEGDAALAALRDGARGVVPPDASAAIVAAAAAALAAGLAVLPPALLARLVMQAGSAFGNATDPVRTVAPEATASLTRREREVLALLAAGASNKVVARRLGLSFHTAKAHVAAVLQKLGASSRADAVARGARAGLVLL